MFHRSHISLILQVEELSAIIGMKYRLASLKVRAGESFSFGGTLWWNILLLWLYALSTHGQYPPPAGQPGSTAIYKDSIIIERWADACIVQRGWRDIRTKDDTTSFGSPSNAVGPADGSIVSLGDSGIALLTFDPPIRDRLGPDFAVFENAFNDSFLELAHVEVSSDGVHFLRFPSVSLTDTSHQVGSFGAVDARKIHNLAGKYRVFYGTPFDLADLPDSPVWDRNAVRYIRLIDAVGVVHGPYATYDSRGHPINDPFPTPYPTGGFDLDAVAVLNTELVDTKHPYQPSQLSVYYSPRGTLHIRTQNLPIRKMLLCHSNGWSAVIPLAHIVTRANNTTEWIVECAHLPIGHYFILAYTPDHQIIRQTWTKLR